MLKRAWYCLAVPWAILMLWLASSHRDVPGGVYIVALGPLFVPQILRLVLRFIAWGRLRQPRVVPYRTPR